MDVAGRLRRANRFITPAFPCQATPKVSLIEHSLLLPILIFLGTRPSNNCHRSHVVKHCPRSVPPGIHIFSHMLIFFRDITSSSSLSQQLFDVNCLAIIISSTWSSFTEHIHRHIADIHRFGVLAQEHCLRYLVSCRIACPAIPISNQGDEPSQNRQPWFCEMALSSLNPVCTMDFFYFSQNGYGIGNILL